MFWFFGHEACGILAPGPGIKPPLFVLEGEVLTTGPPGKSLGYMALDKLLHIYELHTFFLKKKQTIYLAALVAAHGTFFASCRIFSCSVWAL